MAIHVINVTGLSDDEAMSKLGAVWDSEVKGGNEVSVLSNQPSCIPLGPCHVTVDDSGGKYFIIKSVRPTERIMESIDRKVNQLAESCTSAYSTDHDSLDILSKLLDVRAKLIDQGF